MDQYFNSLLVRPHTYRLRQRTSTIDDDLRPREIRRLVTAQEGKEFSHLARVGQPSHRDTAGNGADGAFRV